MGRLMFTWNCTSSKDVETVQQNSEVDLETNQIFPYSELLKDVSLEEISRNSVISNITFLLNLPRF